MGITCRRLIQCLTLFAIALAFTPESWAAPEPSIVPRNWQLDFTFGKPKPIAVPDVGGEVRWYWYMTYKVTNNTGDDRLFIPDFTIATDEGEMHTAGKGIPARTFDLIKEREKNPLLLSPIDIVGKLLQGEDYARESVAIWPHFRKEPSSISIFAAGLSGETQRVIFGRTLRIEEKQAGRVVFDGQYSSEEDIRDVPANARQKMTRIDMSIEGLEREANANPNQEGVTVTVKIVTTPESWTITYEDRDHRITITQKRPGEEFVLRKTLMIQYDTPGQNVHPQQQPFIPTEEQWILR
jgi:hypothetical protein